MTDIKLQYGIRDGKAIHIDDLTDENRGLKCNCTCPGCGAVLQARLGHQRIRHFAHHRAPECNIHVARQTALHLMAKDIIAREKKIILPEVTFNFHETQAYANLRSIIKQRPSLWEPFELQEQLVGYDSNISVPARIVEFDTVILEKRVSDFIPDIIASKNGHECMIEIAVTHFVDEEKEKKVRKLGISTLDIDLSHWAGETLDEKALTDILVNNTAHKKWIYNALFAPQVEKIEKDAQHVCEQYWKALENRAEYKRYKEAEKAKRKARAPKLLQEAFLPENYRMRLQSDRNDKRFFDFYKTLNISTKCPRVPFYVDIPISGEFIFNCDRRIWQSQIFDKFVFHRKSPLADEYNIMCKKITSWIVHHQKNFNVRWDYNFECRVNDTWCLLLPDVVDQYLSYLSTLGFISYLRGHDGVGKVIAHHTIMPPNSQQAQLLKEAIDHADPYDPNIDAFIAQYMYTSQLERK